MKPIFDNPNYKDTLKHLSTISQLLKEEREVKPIDVGGYK